MIYYIATDSDCQVCGAFTSLCSYANREERNICLGCGEEYYFDDVAIKQMKTEFKRTQINISEKRYYFILNNL